MLVEYELLRGTALASSASDRAHFAPYGLEGGSPGQTATFTLIHEGERRGLPSKFGNLEMVAGDVMEIATSGGGGYGAPVAEG
jgi:N-methylhydantoinase B/oxoprolinase/acetone carboxylase alpha subunit